MIVKEHFSGSNMSQLNSSVREDAQKDRLILSKMGVRTKIGRNSGEVDQGMWSEGVYLINKVLHSSNLSKVLYLSSK